MLTCSDLTKESPTPTSAHIQHHQHTHNITRHTYLDLHRVVEDLAREGLHCPGEGGAEHDCLAVRPDVVDDARDLQNRHRT